MKAALGNALFRDENALESALRNSEGSYVDYVIHELRDAVDATRGIRPLNPPPPRALEMLRMKFATDPAPVNRIEDLVDKFHLARVKLNPASDSTAMRQWLIEHRLRQTVEWCTGQPVK
jgi:hypothetical protein